MARTTFFSFHYQDVESFRVNVIRNSNMFKKPGDSSKVIDGSLWEASRLKGNVTLKKLIDNALIGTSATAVLIGTNTHERTWVKYEIVRSFVTGKAILGIHLNQILEAHTRQTTAKGFNPFKNLAVFVPDDYKTVKFLEKIEGVWQQFSLLPTVTNRRKNTVYFDKGFFTKIGLGPSDNGRIIPFSALFDVYCWKDNNGYKNLAAWIEKARLKRTHKV